jgi:hypothetical protein
MLKEITTCFVAMASMIAISGGNNDVQLGSYMMNPVDFYLILSEV